MRHSGVRAHRATSVGAVDGDELPHISPRHLRSGDDMCRRRLAREIHSGKRNVNKTADMRFAVSNRIEADARLAQAECGPPRREAFVEREAVEVNPAGERWWACLGPQRAGAEGQVV